MCRPGSRDQNAALMPGNRAEGDPDAEAHVIVLPAVAALLMSAAVAFAAIPPHPKWQSSSKEGTWNHDNYLCQNDMWSCPQAACH